MQSTEAGERDEHEPERQAGRAAARRPSPGDDGRAVRDPLAAAGTDEVGGKLPVGGVRSQTGHGGHQARARHRATSQRRNRGTPRICRPAGGTYA